MRPFALVYPLGCWRWEWGLDAQVEQDRVWTLVHGPRWALGCCRCLLRCCLQNGFSGGWTLTCWRSGSDLCCSLRKAILLKCNNIGPVPKPAKNFFVFCFGIGLYTVLTVYTVGQLLCHHQNPLTVHLLFVPFWSHANITTYSLFLCFSLFIQHCCDS